MNDMTNAEVVEEELRREGPGRRLREAREAKQLSLEEAAGKLCMHVKLVRAMEADDYAALPPPAFIIGYLRNYSRLVGLPAQEVLDTYNAHRSEPQTSTLADVHSAREAHEGGGTGMRLFTWAVIIALVVLLGLWWQQGGALWVTSQLAGSPAAGISAAPGEPADVAPEPVGTTAPEVPWVVESTDEVAGTAAAAVEQAEPVPAAAPVEVEPVTAMPELKLVFEGDSWTRVTDADDNRLVADLMRKGQTRTLTGKAPFELTLGYASGVVVHYNGVVFDHSRFHARNIARFHVGSADDNPPE